jgi:hypothetical protein
VEQQQQLWKELHAYKHIDHAIGQLQATRTPRDASLRDFCKRLHCLEAITH